ncbi:MAG TPA: hypothetical protein VLX56_06530, partial [Nitrososphaerales archaeon]|nr:hypothetical protein [Nitrososphaerales archaeon]
MAGIVATVIMFAILFTVGTSYFIFINSSNQKYVSSLMGAANKAQGAVQETVTLTSLLETNGDVGLQVTDTSGMTVNVTAILVISSTGVLLKCDGVGFPGSAGCANSTPALWTVVDAGATSASIDTGYVYVSGTTDTIKVLTARGNTFTTTYPAPANQSSSSQSVTVNLDNLKWVQLIPQASSLVQKKYVSNCNAAACAASYTSSVTAANILVDAVSWPSSSPPASVPTDTLHDSFTLGASSSVNVASSPAIVQSKYTSNCNAASCGLAFSSNVASGDTLVFGLGWANQSPPSAPTDTRGDTYTLGESQSVTINPPATSLVQSRYTSNCNSVTCGLAYSSSVTAGNTLVFGLAWYGTAPYVPITVSNCASYPTLSLDGNNYNDGTGSTLSASLTTTNTNDVIITVVTGQNTATGTYQTPSLSDGSGLTWQARSTLEEVSSVGGYSYYGQIFYAIAASALSGDSIKVTWNSAPTHYGTLQVFGVSGANTASPFDPDPALPAFASASYATVTTANTNDFVYGAELTHTTGSPTAGGGFTGIESGVGGSVASEYEVVSSLQSALSMTFSNAGTDSDGSWGDAIQRSTSCTSATEAMDGSTGASTESSSVSASLTTTNSNDVIILSAGTSSSSATVSSVSDTGGHSWTHRASESGNPSVEVEEWYTTASSPLSSDSITVTWSGAGDNTFSAFGISGVNTASPFDSNGALPAKSTGTSTTPSVTVSTSNANDMVFGLLANEHTSAAVCHTETDGTGFTDTGATQCATGGSASQNNDQEYEVVSSTQTNLAIPFTTSSGGSNQWAMIGDAVVAGSGSATPSTFQEMVTWNPSAYSTYEASNLGNIRFCADSACATPLDAWLESCSSTCGPSNTSATAWVKLTSAISSGSTTTIYMVFYSTSTNFDDNYWGEAPTLSGTYAQYDNGANVFNDYAAFQGSSLPAGWTLSGAASFVGGTGNTGGVKLVSNSNNQYGAAKSPTSFSTLGACIETSAEYNGNADDVGQGIYASGVGTNTGGYGPSTSNSNGYYASYEYYSNSKPALRQATTTLASASSQTLPTSGTNFIFMDTCATSGQITMQYATNTGTQYAAGVYSGLTTTVSYSATISAAGSTSFVGAATGGSTSYAYLFWDRIRMYPPNGVMPSTNVGSVTTGNGSPTGPTDTLGDTFTLGASNSVSITNVNYYSYIWYTTAASSGADTISATFSSAVTGSVSIYELQGYSTVSPSTSTGASSAGSTTPAVTGFTPTTNSFVIGNVETSSSSSVYTAGSGFTLVAACSSVYGCNEYKSGSSGATTVPSTLGVSAPWVESAISFAPLTANTYYSYIWYATAGSAGADTISASFGSSVAGEVSIYEMSGVTTTGLLSSTSSSSASQSSSSVTSMTPNSGSVVIGNAEVSSTTYTAGSGYTLSGACTSVGGCGEYQTGVGSATTVPFSFSGAVPWAESAVAFAPVTTNYYSYIWYATAATGGADTVTTTFSGTTAGSVSLYEITGYTTSGALSSTGSLATGSTT